MIKKEQYEEGLFYFINQYLELNRANGDQLKLKMDAHQQWNTLSKYMKQKYQQKYEESLEQKIVQQQENETEQIELQNSERTSQDKGQHGKTPPKPRGKGRRTISIENNGQQKKQRQSTSVKIRASLAQAQKQQQLKQQQEEQEEQEQIQRLKDISKSKVSSKQKIQVERNDVLNLKKVYNLDTYIQHYKMVIKGKKQKNR